MRKYLLYVCYGIVALALEGTWLAHFPTHRVHLDLVLMAVATVSFTESWKDGLPTALTLGALQDAASASPLGLSILTYGLIYITMRAIVSQISFQMGLGRIVWIAFISLMNRLLGTIILLGLSAQVAPFWYWVRQSVAQVSCDILTGLVLVPFLIWYSHLTWEKLTRPKGLVLR